ncbi:hypothetical protein GGP41_002006 [Bipolaris sorokiniana]|uniref:Rhodopsin domain-containing protein n=2 Tax=Cochliobolus sativus TaxID=45130 RepID=A0A8H6DZ89_COCSA|nr:uncharacterized protein COCSADRAFT_221284 [Bipolaris sorokiniana ND90Pr]EMD62475.1 hypothetical protein COCSADRAFT_221284 [Bipolaris sorokiniana ND90Pr]KAF5853439.1 hypothetical protein GGP41_002006 [Bipolaris sorokiniana]
MKDRSGEILAIGITFLLLSWLTVGLRCFVRVHMVKGFGIDDYTMVVTLLFFTGYLISQIGGAINGSGVRRIHLTDESAQTALHFWFFCEIFYTLSTCMLKISVGFFLLRITIVPLHIWIIRLIMVVSGLVGIAYTSVVIFQCKPISYWWDLNPNAVGSCLSPALVMNFTFVVSGLNAFADWVFAILPVLIVQGLHMKKRMKVVVASVIALAAIGSTATIIRLPYTTTIKGYKGDFLFRTTDFAIWSTIEVGLGISAGSIATLRPLLKQAFEITRSASAMPWSKPSLKSGQEQSGHQLSVIKPSIQKSITITTSRARRESKESDEERFLGSSMPSEAWQQQQGLPGYITSTVLDEQAARASMDRSRKHGQKQNRRGSPGGSSQSTVDSKESGKAPKAHVHERF